MKLIKVIAIIWILQVLIYSILKGFTSLQVEIIYLLLGGLGAISILIKEIDKNPRKNRSSFMEDQVKSHERALDETRVKIRGELKEGNPTFWIFAATTIMFIVLPFIGYYIIF